MDAPQAIVSVAKTANSPAQTPTKAASDDDRWNATPGDIARSAVAAMTPTPFSSRFGGGRVEDLEGAIADLRPLGRRALAVFVVPVPPLVGRRLRVAFRRVLPLLLTPERGD